MCTWQDGLKALVLQQMGRQVEPFDIDVLNPGNRQVEAAFGHPLCLRV